MRAWPCAAARAHPTPPPAARQATIVPRGHALGMVSQVPDKDEYSTTKQQMLAHIDVCMGGKAAEALIFGEEFVTSGATSDLRAATLVARHMVEGERGRGRGRPGAPGTSGPARARLAPPPRKLKAATYTSRLPPHLPDCGMSARIGPVAVAGDAEPALRPGPEVRRAVDEEVASLLKDAYGRVEALLRARERELHALAAALLQRETLTQVGRRGGRGGRLVCACVVVVVCVCVGGAALLHRPPHPQPV